jgi:hypothetical protein
MKTKNTLCKMSCLVALFLAVSVSIRQASSALQKTEEPIDESSTEIENSPDSSFVQKELQEDDNHEKHSCCRVVLVPVEQPPSSIQLMQSTEQFTTNVTFSANITAAQRSVILRAISEWVNIIETRGYTPANYPIEFSNGPLAGTILSEARVTYNSGTGDLVSTEIVIDNDGTTTWFVDSTPADDSEFNDTPPTGTDLLTVMRHEIGHAVGFANTPRVSHLLSGGIYDPGRLNIAIDLSAGLHTDPDIHADDLMAPLIESSIRRAISLYPDAALVARAYHYDITMRFVDRFTWGIESGSANRPWNTFKEGIFLTPSYHELLVIPRTYREAIPIILSEPITISAARGGDAVITGP